MAKIYLGDSVYAEWSRDDGMVRLTTENGPGAPGNVIWLEPEVMEALLAFWKIVLEGPASD